MERYDINYTYIVNECSGDGLFRPITLMLNNRSLRSYTLTDGLSTPVEEDGRYFITLTAVNSVTMSGTTEAVPSPVITGEAGRSVPITCIYM